MDPRSFSALPADVKFLVFSFFNTRAVLKTFGELDRQHRNLLQESKAFWIGRLQRDFGVPVFPGMEARNCYTMLTAERRIVLAYQMVEECHDNIRGLHQAEYYLLPPEKMRSLKEDGFNLRRALQCQPQHNALQFLQQLLNKYEQSNPEHYPSRKQLELAYDSLFKNDRHQINLFSRILSKEEDVLVSCARKILIALPSCRAELSLKYCIGHMQSLLPSIDLNNHDFFNHLFYEAVKYANSSIVCLLLEGGFNSNSMLLSPDMRLNSGLNALSTSVNALSDFISQLYPAFSKFSKDDMIRAQAHFFNRLQQYEDIMSTLIRFKADPDCSQKFLTMHSRASSVGEFELMMSEYASAISPREMAKIKIKDLLSLLDADKEQQPCNVFCEQVKNKLTKIFSIIINAPILSEDMAYEGSVKRLKCGD